MNLQQLFEVEMQVVDSDRMQHRRAYRILRSLFDTYPKSTLMLFKKTLYCITEGITDDQIDDWLERSVPLSARNKYQRFKGHSDALGYDLYDHIDEVDIEKVNKRLPKGWTDDEDILEDHLRIVKYYDIIMDEVAEEINHVFGTRPY